MQYEAFSEQMGAREGDPDLQNHPRRIRMSTFPHVLGMETLRSTLKTPRLGLLGDILSG